MSKQLTAQDRAVDRQATLEQKVDARLRAGDRYSPDMGTSGQETCFEEFDYFATHGGFADPSFRSIFPIGSGKTVVSCRVPESRVALRS